MVRSKTHKKTVNLKRLGIIRVAEIYSHDLISWTHYQIEIDETDLITTLRALKTCRHARNTVIVHCLYPS